MPPYEIHQTEVEQFARRLFASRPKTFERLAGAYANAGIDKRYSCVPLEWYEQPHGWKDRTKIFVESALDLLTGAARQAIEDAGLVTTDIDGIVTVSSTGLAVPSLDALLMERMPFRRDVHRLPIFGLGCGGGVLGLSRAAALAQAQPGSRWLFLVVELCESRSGAQISPRATSSRPPYSAMALPRPLYRWIQQVSGWPAGVNIVGRICWILWVGISKKMASACNSVAIFHNS